MGQRPEADPADIGEHAPGEEIANTVTHGIGAGLALAGLVFLVAVTGLSGSTLHTVALSVYGVTLVILYGASTLYHAVTGPRVKEALRVFDHCAIFLLIAGTYTPFALIGLGGTWGWGLFATVWVLAVAGILLNLLMVQRSRMLSVPLYLGMGWIGVIAGGELFRALETGALIGLLAGGLMYSGGVIFYKWRRLPYNHAVWHLFVLGGSACHFAAIAVYLAP